VAVTLFVATKAFILNKGKVLLIRESSAYTDSAHAGKFDLPGGRIKPGEPFDNAIIREVFEETGLSITIGAPFFVNESWPVVCGEQWQIVRIFFECSTESEVVQLSKDHDMYVWIAPQDYTQHKIIENLVPVFERFLKNYSHLLSVLGSVL